MKTLTWLCNDEGSALAEFAISVPLLAFVSMAAMAVMAIIQAQFGIQAAAREASMVGANTSSSIDPLDRSIDAAEAEAIRVLAEYNLDPDDATLTFEDNDPSLARGTYFQTQISYIVTIPAPTIKFFSRVLGADTSTFTVNATSVIPIQLYKARWPCPSPDPICS
jgi:endonuclease/exonuclease/phosphatase (EEP) superfamily protein YafD